MRLSRLLVALDVPPGRPVRAGRIAAFATILTLALVADTFALVIGVLPLLVVTALGARGSRPYGALQLRVIALAVLGSVAAAHGLSWLVERLGGYRVVPGRLAEYLAYPDTLQVVQGNIRLLTQNLPSLYRCDLPGEFTAGGLLVWAGCLLGPLFMIWALTSAGSLWRFEGGTRKSLDRGISWRMSCGARWCSLWRLFSGAALRSIAPPPGTWCLLCFLAQCWSVDCWPGE